MEKIWIDPKSRDDIPAVLKGLQHIWSDEELRARLFALLDAHVLPETDREVGRPGMALWRILVLGVLKQGLGCDFDRLHDLANHHETVRAFLGHGDFADKTYYEYQTVLDNVCLLTPELLSEVGRLVVESGHTVAKKKPGERLRGRCDSFVVETDVHYPTDVSLLWDALRCLLRETGRAAGRHAVGGWRQWRHLSKEVRKLFNQVRSTRRAKRHPERVEAYLERCRALVARTMETLDELRDKGVEETTCQSIQGFIAHAQRQLGQVERRLLRGEAIAHEEKVFSVFEEHTRWVSKGKAGTPVELGVPVALIEDQHQFILHHKNPVGGRGRRRGGADGEGSPGAVSRTAGVQLRPGAFTALTTESSSTRCSTSTRCRERGIFPEPTANGRRRNPSRPRGVRIRQSSRPSMGWNTGGSTVSAAMERTASRAPSHCRYWPPTCIASGCSCKSASANDDDPPPDRPLPLKHAVTPTRRKDGKPSPSLEAGRPG